MDDIPLSILSIGFLVMIGFTFLRLIANGREAAVLRAEAEVTALADAEKLHAKQSKLIVAETVKMQSDVELVPEPAGDAS